MQSTNSTYHIRFIILVSCLGDVYMRDNVNSSGIGFTGMLQVAFIVLKLLDVIDWKWVWVLSPFIISTILGLLFIIGFRLWVKRYD